MDKRTLRIISIVALCFAAIFSVSFILVLFNISQIQAIVSTVAIASGLITFGLYIILRLNGAFKTPEKEKAEGESAEGGSGDAPQDEKEEEEAKPSDSD